MSTEAARPIDIPARVGRAVAAVLDKKGVPYRFEDGTLSLPREVWEDRMRGMAFWQDPALQEYMAKLQTDEQIRAQEAAEPEPWEVALGVGSELIPGITYEI